MRHSLLLLTRRQCVVPLLLALALLAWPAAPRAQLGDTNPPHASGGPVLPEEAAYDVQHYDLSLRVDPAQRTIDGACIATVRIVHPTAWFVLDLDPRLAVHSVTEVVSAGDVMGRRVQFQRKGWRLWCALPMMRQPGETLRVRIAYGGKPKVAPRPPWDDGFVWSKTPSGAPWVGVTCEGEGACNWWPCKDSPSDRAHSMAAHITVPAPLVCAASGHLTGVRENHDGTRTFDWVVSTPINNYAMSINIAPYRTLHTVYKSISGDATQVYFYALPEDYDKAGKLLQSFLPMVRFLEEKCGPYPFRIDKIGVAEAPYLGMEHQTITAYGNHFRTNPFGFDDLLYHEFAHEWFANLVTNYDWKDMWLHEGFASYMEALYAEHLKGEKGYVDYLARFRRNIANHRAVASRETLDAAQVYVDGDIYYKGACFLDTLRYLIGDRAFFTALRRMAYPDPRLERVEDGAQCRFATTDDFLRIAEAASVRQLEWLFEIYLRQPKLPRLDSVSADGKLTLRWRVPNDLPFPMPVDVRIGSTTRRVIVPAAGVTVSAPTGETPVIDPDNRVLKAP